MVTASALLPDLSTESNDTARMARHQIRNHLQAIHIGLHVLERHLDLSESDVQEELVTLRASLHKTVRVMDTLVRLQKIRTSQTLK